ncbi:MAG: IS1595 family transposase [Rhodospirillaceae bacterium]|nr:IS1595 family transposase [Rhodospirillaceae bacterium]
MAKSFTVQDFFKRFPTDDACLEHLFAVRYGSEPACPKCGEIGKFGRLAKLPAWTCNCGHHLHPMKGTPFERTHTPLQKWFYAMYLFTTSRHGVPAKELQRQLGVTYKTAWRIGHEIRKYMGKVDGDYGLGGHVEVDEAYIGGKTKGGKRGRGTGKTAILGMVERNGDVITRVIPNAKGITLEREILANVHRGSRISTDQYTGYRYLDFWGYRHQSVNHSADEWVRGDVHTNTIENFWSRLKNSIRGTHIHVSAKHLPKYLGEFEFRFNRRRAPLSMFSDLMAGF